MGVWRKQAFQVEGGWLDGFLWKCPEQLVLCLSFAVLAPFFSSSIVARSISIQALVSQNLWTCLAGLSQKSCHALLW